jgi:H-type lectin domain
LATCAAAKKKSLTLLIGTFMQSWKSLSATVQVGRLTEGWTLATPATESHDSVRVLRFAVYFSAPFDAPPVVHLGLTGFDLDQRDASRLTLTATEITVTGFIAEIATWRETRVYSVAFSWLALGS